MAATGTIDRQRVAAWLVVAAVHAGLGWLLLRASIVRVPAGTLGDDALQLTWIEPPSPADPGTPADRAAPVRGMGRKPERRVVRAPIEGAAAPVVPQPPAPAAGLSAVFLEQARRLTHAAPGGAVAADPFANRDARLPGHEASAFRMREPRSLQGALRKVGALFGGAGYSTDPCPQIRKNVAALGNGEGSERELLQEELRRQRAYCH